MIWLQINLFSASTCLFLQRIYSLNLVSSQHAVEVCFASALCLHTLTHTHTHTTHTHRHTHAHTHLCEIQATCIPRYKPAEKRRAEPINVTATPGRLTRAEAAMGPVIERMPKKERIQYYVREIYCSRCNRRQVVKQPPRIRCPQSRTRRRSMAGSLMCAGPILQVGAFGFLCTLQC